MNSDLTSVLNLLDSYLGSAQYFPFLLLGTGIFFTLYLKFPQLRFFKHALRIVRGKYDKEEVSDATHFQALATAISGTVGTGQHWWGRSCYLPWRSSGFVLDVDDCIFRYDH
ncbi:MAG: hypothetical protein ACNYPE_04065 [Candidatus Azotimanducaceae bacterium WSBS_2022_MAG_OTU7]